MYSRAGRAPIRHLSLLVRAKEVTADGSTQGVGRERFESPTGDQRTGGNDAPARRAVAIAPAGRPLPFGAHIDAGASARPDRGRLAGRPCVDRARAGALAFALSSRGGCARSIARRRSRPYGPCRARRSRTTSLVTRSCWPVGNRRLRQAVPFAQLGSGDAVAARDRSQRLAAADRVIERPALRHGREHRLVERRVRGRASGAPRAPAACDRWRCARAARCR